MPCEQPRPKKYLRRGLIAYHFRVQLLKWCFWVIKSGHHDGTGKQRVSESEMVVSRIRTVVIRVGK
jgi:hypothetical protein